MFLIKTKLFDGLFLFTYFLIIEHLDFVWIDIINFLSL